MANYVSKLLETALNEVGYLEKKSNSKLDSKTANAGYNNWTKYARDLDALGFFYNGKKNGYAWCDMFVDWCFVKAFGVEEAMKLLQQPKKSYGAGCGPSANYYKQKGQFYKSNPKKGDQIFFWSAKKDRVAHTGLVYKVDSTYVYTIEGNTSSTSGVIANGGGVFKKKYKLNYTRIHGYGRPKYDKEPNVVEKKPGKIDYDYNPTVKEWQKAAKADGFKFPRHGIDGKWGKECESVVQKAVVKQRVTHKYRNLTKLVQKIVETDVDGKCGPKTKEAIRTYQSLNGLKVDGSFGPACWRHALKVK